MIPVSDVESELLKNPAVGDVALVDYLDKKEGQLPCAVFVPETDPPIIPDKLRRYLSNDRPAGVCRGAAAQRQRQVRKELLRRWLVRSPLSNEWGRPCRDDRALENRTVGRGRVACAASLRVAPVTVLEESYGAE
jgi:acyl-CoA synthetase (AMP-forming)/AMP-acid ligase II